MKQAFDPLDIQQAFQTGRPVIRQAFHVAAGQMFFDQGGDDDETAPGVERPSTQEELDATDPNKAPPMMAPPPTLAPGVMPADQAPGINGTPSPQGAPAGTPPGSLPTGAPAMSSRRTGLPAFMSSPPPTGAQDPSGISGGGGSPSRALMPATAPGKALLPSATARTFDENPITASTARQLADLDNGGENSPGGGSLHQGPGTRSGFRRLPLKP